MTSKPLTGASARSTSPAPTPAAPMSSSIRASEFSARSGSFPLASSIASTGEREGVRSPDQRTGEERTRLRRVTPPAAAARSTTPTTRHTSADDSAPQVAAGLTVRSSRNDARALPASGPHSCCARRRIYHDDRAREVDQSPSSRRRRPIAVSVAILAALSPAACGRRRRRRGRGKLRWRDGDGRQLCVRPERADRRSRRDAAQRGQRRTQLHDGRSRVDAEAEGEEANVTAPDEAGTQPNPVCVKGRCWGAAGSGPSSGAPSRGVRCCPTRPPLCWQTGVRRRGP